MNRGFQPPGSAAHAPSPAWDDTCQRGESAVPAGLDGTGDAFPGVETPG